MAVSAARPGGALSSGSLTGDSISSLSSDSAMFFIKTTSAVFRASVPVVESTGSGDTTVKYEHGDKPYYDIQLQGVMLADEGVKLQNLTAQIGSDGTPAVQLDFKFSGLANIGDTGTNKHAFENMNVIVTQCQISYDPKMPVVGVALAMKSMVGTNTGLQTT